MTGPEHGAVRGTLQVVCVRDDRREGGGLARKGG